MAIKEPKVASFLFFISASLYLLFEPIANEYLAARRLGRLKQQLKKDLEEKKLLKTFTEDPGKTVKIERLINDLEAVRPSNDVNSALALLANQNLCEEEQQIAILEALKCLKKE